MSTAIRFSSYNELSVTRSCRRLDAYRLYPAESEGHWRTSMSLTPDYRAATGRIAPEGSRPHLCGNRNSAINHNLSYGLRLFCGTSR